MPREQTLVERMSRVLGAAAQVAPQFLSPDLGAIPLTIATWLGRMQEHLFGSLLVYARQGIPCRIGRHGVPCQNPSVGLCACCEQVTACMQHAAVLEDGRICCYVCIQAQAQQRRQGGSPPPHSKPRDASGSTPANRDVLTRQHLATLGLTPPTTISAIRAQYRARVAQTQSHPDQGGDPQRHKVLTDAFNWLEQNYDPEAYR